MSENSKSLNILIEKSIKQNWEMMTYILMKMVLSKRIQVSLLEKCAELIEQNKEVEIKIRKMYVYFSDKI